MDWQTFPIVNMANVLPWLMCPVLPLEIKLPHAHHSFVIQISWIAANKKRRGNGHKLQHSRFPVLGKKISLWELLDIGKNCPRKLWNLHSWRASKLDQTRSWATWGAPALLWAGVQMKCPPEILSNLNYCITLWKYSVKFLVLKETTTNKTIPSSFVIY